MSSKDLLRVKNEMDRLSSLDTEDLYLMKRELLNKVELIDIVSAKRMVAEQKAMNDQQMQEAESTGTEHYRREKDPTTALRGAMANERNLTS